MKKILAMVLAMMLVLSMSVAFAADEESTTTTTTSDKWVSAAVTGATTIYKDYTGATVFPVEQLTFVSTPNTANPTTENLTVNGITTSALTNNAITIDLPSYSKVGVYEYTITETAKNSQAVTYSTESIGVKVLVTYDYTNKCLKPEIVLTTAGSTDTNTSSKLDTFTNTYKVGNLQIGKTVSGNLASDTQYFKMTVTFVAEKDVNSDITVSATSNASNPAVITKGWTGTKTVDIYLKATETITFSNIPAGVTYTVNEDDAHAAEDPTKDDSSKGYTVTGEQLTAETIVADQTATETINNHKDATVTTGIALDNAPYMILMALVVVAGAALIVKRASANR